MNLRTITLSALAATAIVALPAVAEAAWGRVTTDANLRSCPSTSCMRGGTVPDGARVWIGDRQNGWFSISFNGRSGFVAGSLIVSSDRGPGPDFRGPPPRSGYWKRPWWDDRHHAWYDGRRWYHNGLWYNDPSGFSFGFSFGG